MPLRAQTLRRQQRAGAAGKMDRARQRLADPDLLAPGRARLRAWALEATKLTVERGAAPTAVLFDPTGKVGHSYGAQVTPHMYVIGGDGVLRYVGGIDDKPTTRV